MRSSNDIEADESMRLLGVDNGSALQAEDDVEAFGGDESPFHHLPLRYLVQRSWQQLYLSLLHAL